MANWAKLQEDLVGLPVAKRAKHGIHFQKSAGEFVANFSGKPCHYEDGGIWKPIDTKLLLLPDGFYGCPHSKVKVHPDGRVAVAGTDYAQRVELPSAKTGLADGDKLIREFSFGKQEMRITEDGFKSEITLNRIPTLAEARKLIASESGTLSKEYLKSLTTATDANGDTHTVSTLSAFRTWLASAKFPVVIDPDFTSATGGGGDTGLSSNYQDRGYGTGNTFAAGSTIAVFLMRFDLTSIGADSTPTGASLLMTKTYATSTGAYTTYIYGVKAANGDWIESTKQHTTAGANEPCWDAKKADGSGGVTTAWAGSEGCQTAGTDYESDAYGSISWNREDDAGSQYTFTFNAAGISCVGTWFGTNDINYGLILPNVGAMSSYGRFATSENSTESYRPVLTVTYTAGGALLKVNMNAQMSNLTGGIHG